MRYPNHIRNSFLFFALAVPLAFMTYTWYTGARRQQAGPVLPAGTRIAVTVIENVMAGERDDGRLCSAVVDREVRTQDTIIIPKGSPAHVRVAKGAGPADGGIALYSVQLVDVELNGEKRTVSTDTRDIPVDLATGSPYPGRVTGVLIVANTLFEFTLKSPFPARSS